MEEDLMAPTYGERVLPAPQDLPAEVADKIAAHGEATTRAHETQTALGSARRVELPAAKARDVEQHAAAIERGERPPKPVHEAKAVVKIAALERELSARELVTERCRLRMNEAIAEHGDRIAHAAEARLARARRQYSEALDGFEVAVAELAKASALSVWSKDTSAMYKERAGPVVPVVQHSSDGVSMTEVVAALRAAIEPKRPRGIPSPFAVPAAEPAPTSTLTGVAAELAAGLPSPEA
jgi:hypothetical protein